jgi:hypothetical protein
MPPEKRLSKRGLPSTLGRTGPGRRGARGSTGRTKDGRSADRQTVSLQDRVSQQDQGSRKAAGDVRVSDSEFGVRWRRIRQCGVSTVLRLITGSKDFAGTAESERKTNRVAQSVVLARRLH